MKAIVFGATGTIGKHLVSQLLTEGHSVTAFSRNAQKIGINDLKLVVKNGDVLNPMSVSEAVAGHDVVFCALGDGNKGVTRAAGTKNIVDAMKRHGVKRLIVQTTLGLGSSAGNLNFFWKNIMFGLLLKKAFQDHIMQEEIIHASGLDYTIVRPSAFMDVPRSKDYRIGFGGDEKGLKLKIGREDVAGVMIEQINDTKWMRGEVSVSY